MSNGPEKHGFWGLETPETAQFYGFSRDIGSKSLVAIIPAGSAS